MLTPSSIEELASALHEAGSRKQTVEIGGAFSKRSYGGPIAPSAVTISTSAMNKVLEYEPKDLTVSVQAGLKWSEFQRILAANNQMVPLDPPHYDKATVGGVLAANTSGPRRRLFGSVRDAVIGMKFVTVDGVEIQSGGMVVKNVAGLDMGKLIIGSLGTLAAIAVVNFKLTPIPPCTATFLLPFGSLAEAIQKRDAILAGVLLPSAIDLISPGAAGARQWTLALGVGATERVMQRYRRELTGAEVLEGAAEATFWTAVREFPATAATCTRVPVELQQVGEVLRSAPAPSVARAGNGIVYTAFDDPAAAAKWIASLPYAAVIESAPPESPVERWPRPGGDLEVMKKVKQMLDPGALLNRGRMYGRL